MNSAAAGT